MLSDATTIEEIYNVWNLLLDLDCYLTSVKDSHGLKTWRSWNTKIFEFSRQKSDSKTAISKNWWLFGNDKKSFEIENSNETILVIFIHRES